MGVDIVTPSGIHDTPGYSHAVRMGDLVFVSGQVARGPTGALVGANDIRAQAEQVFANLAVVLEAAGSSLDRVGKFTVLATKLEYRPVIAEIRDRIYTPFGYFPASTFTVVSSLAFPELLVEIEAVATLTPRPASSR